MPYAGKIEDKFGKNSLIDAKGAIVLVPDMFYVVKYIMS